MMEQTAPSINFPEWTEYREKNGLDPLGMQNASVNLYQTFLPGLSNVTLRMRYYGLYAWLCRAYAHKVGDTNPQTWKRYVRRTEALYALIACRHGGEGGVAGIDWATKALGSESEHTIDFGEAAEPGSEVHYLQQAWGAYGAAYGSQLFEIGILTASREHEIPVVSADTGEPLASAFEEALGPLAEELFGVVERGTVSAAELGRFQPLAPSEIGGEGNERALYQDILLRPNAEGDSALSRRLSILLILRIAGLLARDPRPDEVRWILYAGCDQGGGALDFRNDDALAAQRERWWIYQANDLCHVAYETLLKFTLDNIGRYPSGIALQRLVPLCAAQMLQAAGAKPASWSALLESISPAENAYSNEPGSEWSLAQQIIRGAGRRDDKVCPPERAWDAIRLLAILHRRVQGDGHDIAADLGHFDPDGFRSLLTETRFLERHAGEEFGAFLERLLEERIVRRHLWVAFRKFRYQRDYTFLFEMDDGLLRLRDIDGPVFTNPRLGPAITFLKDIHLIGGQGLTDLGVQAAGA
jgi:hypothetical protein